MVKNKDFFTEMIIEWKNILIKPNQTLSEFEDRKLSKSTIYILIAGFIAGALYKIISAFMGQKAVGVIIFTPILVVILMYTLGFFIWVLGKLFKTKISLSKWLSLFFAAWAPIGALSGIPYIMYILQLYGVYIQYLSLRNFMKLSIIRSILVIVLSILAIFAVSILYYV